MTEPREQSSPSEASVSPTLKPGRRYLSIIAHVSGENAQRLEEWKRGPDRVNEHPRDRVRGGAG